MDGCCPNCGAIGMRELGYEDGVGDYGESVTLIYKCDFCGEVCDEREIVYCIDYGLEESVNPIEEFQ